MLKKQNKHAKTNMLKAIDFFCSGGGMTCGLSQAGVDVIAGVDNDPTCKETYEINNPSSKYLLYDIKKLKEEELQKLLGLKKNDPDLILVGCSPCQYWSIIRTDKTKARKSKNLLSEFQRFVTYFKPGYVLVENVPGILTRKNKSGLDKFINILKSNDYSVYYDCVNMNEYGVPQKRRRFTLIASRLHGEDEIPKPQTTQRTILSEYLGKNNGFPQINAGNRDNSVFNHSTAFISDINLKRIERTTKNGGSRSDWEKDRELKRINYKGNGFPDNYGRMCWNKPAPTITTKFLSVSNGRFGHPVENRGISLREGATLQTFPKEYAFPHKSIHVSARIIGNAVPPLYARNIAENIIKKHKIK